MEPVTSDGERLFVRLIMKADDFGRYHADPRLIRAGCFPLLTTLRDTDIAHWTAQCEKAGLIFVYQVGGRSYLAIVNFKQRGRADKSKFPPPEDKPPDWRPVRDGPMTVTCPSNDGRVTALDGDVDEDECVKRAREAEDEHEPVIPTIEDVLAFTRCGAGIPDDYARHYVDTCCVNKRWLVRTAKGVDLREWRREIVVWWTRDRATWSMPSPSQPKKDDWRQSL